MCYGFTYELRTRYDAAFMIHWVHTLAVPRHWSFHTSAKGRFALLFQVIIHVTAVSTNYPSLDGSLPYRRHAPKQYLVISIKTPIYIRGDTITNHLSIWSLQDPLGFINRYIYIRIHIVLAKVSDSNLFQTNELFRIIQKSVSESMRLNLKILRLGLI